MGGTMTPPSESISPVDGIRKRVCKACDRCRLKKSKCDGSTPCSRCKADNAICVFGERKKSHDKVYPKGYVEMLETQQQQLVQGLQELYRRLNTGAGWLGSPLKEDARGAPLTHDILDRLGVLQAEGRKSPEVFEENLDLLQRRLLANGAGFMQRENSFDTISEADSPVSYESTFPHHMPSFNNPFSSSRFPPTPPINSPHPPVVKTGSPLKTQVPFTNAQSIANNLWIPDTMQYHNAIAFEVSSDPKLDTSNMDMMTLDELMSAEPMATAINPCMTMKSWHPQEDSSMNFFNHGVYS